MKMLTRHGYPIKAQGMTYLAERAAHNALRPLQATSCTYRIAFGPRAEQKVLSLQNISPRGQRATPALCANAHGFSLHSGQRCGVDAQCIPTTVLLYHPLDLMSVYQCEQRAEHVLRAEKTSENREAGDIFAQLLFGGRDAITNSSRRVFKVPLRVDECAPTRPNRIKLLDGSRDAKKFTAKK